VRYEELEMADRVKVGNAEIAMVWDAEFGIQHGALPQTPLKKR
jgi:hypothetical protein